MQKICFQNREELFNWILKLYNNGDFPAAFRTIEGFEDFFGISPEWDEKTGVYTRPLCEYTGKIRCEPDTYPAVCLYEFAIDYGHGEDVITVMHCIELSDFKDDSDKINSLQLSGVWWKNLWESEKMFNVRKIEQKVLNKCGLDWIGCDLICHE